MLKYEMTKRLSLILLVTVGIVFSYASLSFAQQPRGAEVSNSTSKPCVVISGAVRSPARYEIHGRIRLAELLRMAGGVTEQAGKTIQIIHLRIECIQAGVKGTESSSRDFPGIDVVDLDDLLRGDEKANPYLDAGDAVTIAESDPIYVTGNVITPRAIHLKDPVTLTRAIAMAGGTISKPKTNKVVIYRRRPNANWFEYITVDLLEIRKQRSPDPLLQPYDIVDVGGVGRLIPPTYRPMFDSRPVITLMNGFLS